MSTLDKIDKATIDDTSTEDYQILMKEYIKNRTETYKTDSKKVFQELVASLQQDVKRYEKV